MPALPSCCHLPAAGHRPQRRHRSRLVNNQRPTAQLITVALSTIWCCWHTVCTQHAPVESSMWQLGTPARQRIRTEHCTPASMRLDVSSRKGKYDIGHGQGAHHVDPGQQGFHREVPPPKSASLRYPEHPVLFATTYLVSSLTVRSIVLPVAAMISHQTP